MSDHSYSAEIDSVHLADKFFFDDGLADGAAPVLDGKKPQGNEHVRECAQELYAADVR